MKIGMSANAAKIASQLRRRATSAVRRANIRAINRTAEDVHAAGLREMRDVFDRPTPFTLRALRRVNATQANPFAEVGFKGRAVKGSAAADYLMPNVAGGVRQLKLMERLLRSAGVLPSGMYIVPGRGARMDAYGNISRGQIVQIISYFRAFPEAGYRSNMDDSGRSRLARGTRRSMGYAYFVGSPGGAPLGVWQRMHSAHGTGVRPVLIFVSRAHYEAERFDFYYVAKITQQKRFEVHFRSALAREMQGGAA